MKANRLCRKANRIGRVIIIRSPSFLLAEITDTEQEGEQVTEQVIEQIERLLRTPE